MEWHTYEARPEINDCWLDPYGTRYEVPPFGHNQFAEDYLQKEYPIDRCNDWGDDPNFFGSYEETLQKRGWVRYTSTIHRWTCENCSDFEEHYPRPTRIQRDVMYELTGYDYDHDHLWEVLN